MMEDYLKKLIAHYRKALRINPNNFAIYNQIAELYYEQGELEKTLEVCQEALQVQPDLALAPQVLYQVLQKLGFDEEEITTLQKSIQNKLGDKTFHAMVLHSEKVKPSADAKTWKDAIALGYALKQEKQWDEAIAANLKAIEIEPALSLPHSELHNIISYCISPQPNQLEKIIASYYQIISRRSTHPFAYVVLGDMLTKEGKIADAIASYGNAIYQDTYLTEKLPQKYNNLNHKASHVNFLIIGVGKSGTTSLFYYMCQHPQILPPIQKELDFFNLKFELGIDWYLAHFSPIPNEGGFLTGEATPWYLGTDGVEEKVFQLFPNIKLIVVLRNPVARAISHYYMNLSMTENRSLEEAITSEMTILRGIGDPTQVSEKYWQTEKGYLWFGLYSYFLEKWMALFPREQFLILHSEDLYNQTANTLQQVFEFLEIPDYSLSDYPKYNSGSYPNISNELRQKLSDFFRPHNQKLEDYLGKKFDWK